MPQTDLTPMYVLTVKRDGGTQDVKRFYSVDELFWAVHDCTEFLQQSRDSRRAIVRLEWYNPQGIEIGGTE